MLPFIYISQHPHPRRKCHCHRIENGPVVIETFPDVAPKHVERIEKLAKAGKYDGVAFHRVIEGFMAQTGDVEFGNVKDFSSFRAGTGGSDSRPQGRI